MGRSPVDVVRTHIGPFSGRDFIAVVSRYAELDAAGGMENATPDEAELSAASEVLHEDAEWEMSPIGNYRGRRGILDFWRDWAQLWESYVYELKSLEQFGACVLSAAEVRARGRDGIEVEMTTYQVWEVREGLIVWQKTFLDHDEAAAEARARG